MAEQTAEEKAAAEKVTADAAAKVASDKAAADKATADAHVAAGKNPDGTPKTADGAKAPVVPDKYELKLPDKGVFTDADLATYGARAKTLGLTSEQAQKMLDDEHGGLQAMSARWLDELKGDKDLGGAKLAATTALAIKGRDKFLDTLPAAEADEIKGWFNRYGFGNHKGLVRAFARLGQLIAEDKPLTAAASGGAGEPKPGSTAALTKKLYPGTPGAGE